MIGCFGKIPASADFISLHGAGEEVCEFDAWLQSNLAELQQLDHWRERFDRLPVCFFYYRARTGHALIGGLISARDSSERRYPFMIFQVVKAGLAAKIANPYTLAELFSTQIKPLLHLALQGEPAASLFARIKELRPLQPQDIDLFGRVQHKFFNDFTLRDIARSLESSYPEFITGAALERLRVLGIEWKTMPLRAATLPLPAERGLKNPVADLWLAWLARLNPVTSLPAVSLLADDFMRPRLLCVPDVAAHCAYRVLTGAGAREERYDLLEPFDVFDEHQQPQKHPDLDLPLSQFMSRFAGAPEVKYV
ncbi:type VI secretion system-associated protein TagF [Pseudomonas eucalypticola]|uniref:Type VI secretion system-associated protein TagF n=1 Tax=Pseudomonas eucalypticola TaxID=2599595 RepID=A0A7D5GYB1_9PSED|nr:type VI secretion system-associated protein TagF [Pseudomonas eucalypticola]QKZ02387.1 type VI secretion system-associated protein TagF [Pseudomonas eucalypticola]